MCVGGGDVWTRSLLLQTVLQEPDDCTRKAIFRAVTSLWFEKVSIACIVLSLVFLSLEHYGQSPLWTAVLLYANHVIVVLFLLEMVLKIVGVAVPPGGNGVANAGVGFSGA